MRKELLLLILFLSCSLILPGTSSAARPTVVPINDEEYKVYSDLLPQAIKGVDEDTPFVIFEYTMLSEGNTFDKQTVKYFEKESGVKLDKKIVQQFKKLNSIPYKLGNKFSDTLKVILLSDFAAEQLFYGSNKGWDNFYKKFPKSCGTVELSRVAFNDDKDKAFLYYGNQRDWLVGTGYYVLLEKSEGKWLVVKGVLAWIS